MNIAIDRDADHIASATTKTVARDKQLRRLSIYLRILKLIEQAFE